MFLQPFLLKDRHIQAHQTTKDFINVRMELVGVWKQTPSVWVKNTTIKGGISENRGSQKYKQHKRSNNSTEWIQNQTTIAQVQTKSSTQQVLEVAEEYKIIKTTWWIFLARRNLKNVYNPRNH